MIRRRGFTSTNMVTMCNTGRCTIMEACLLLQWLILDSLLCTRVTTILAANPIRVMHTRLTTCIMDSTHHHHHHPIINKENTLLSTTGSMVARGGNTATIILRRRVITSRGEWGCKRCLLLRLRVNEVQSGCNCLWMLMGIFSVFFASSTKVKLVNVRERSK